MQGVTGSRVLQGVKRGRDQGDTERRGYRAQAFAGCTGLRGAGGYKAQREDGTRGIQNADVTEHRRLQGAQGDKAAGGDTALSEGRGG